MERLRDEQQPAAREQWGSRAEFLLSCCGYAVGISNVWRFPYLAYENGGGSFLIPYLVALLLMGMPLFLLEVSLGQLQKQGIFHALRAIDPRLRGLGVAGVVCSFVISIYYNVLIAWSLVYAVYSCQSPLPWADDSERFWTEDVLRQSDGMGDGGGVSGSLLAALAVAWVCVYWALRGGVKTSGKVVWVTATVPYVFLVVLFVRSVTLEGAGEGVRYYLEPDWGKLADPDVWATAAGQIFYSLGVCVGSLTAMGSYNPDDENVLADTVIISSMNSATSLFAGFGVFSLLGHMAHEQGVSVADVATSGEGLAFIAYPSVLAELPGANAFAACFFLMLFTLGIDSQLALVEVTMCLFKDLGLRWPQRRILLVLCAVSFALGLPFISGAGIYWFQLVDEYVSKMALFAVGIGECYAVAHLYGAERFANEMEKMTGHRIPDWVLFVWRWVTPAFLVVLTVAQIVQEATDPLEIETPSGEYPGYAQAVGLLVCLVPVLCIAWGALVKERALFAGAVRVVDDSIGNDRL